MSDPGYDRYTTSREENGFARLGGWLARRPMESWLFFFAGFAIARVIF